MRGVVRLVLAFCAALTGCRGPTQITLELRSDAACDPEGDPTVPETEIIAAAPDQLAARPQRVVTSRCPLDGRVGSLAAIPSGALDAQVGFEVVMAVDGSLDTQCAPPDYGDRCIVARRSLRFIPHTPLTLPIDLNSSCLGVFCDPDQTCVDGGCRDAAVTPEECAEGAAGCGEETLPLPPEIVSQWLFTSNSEINARAAFTDVEAVGKGALLAGVHGLGALGGLPVGNNSQVLVELDAAGGVAQLRSLTVNSGPIADPQLARAATGEVFMAAEFSGIVVSTNVATVTTASGVSAIYVATFPATSGDATNLTKVEGGGAVRLRDMAVDGTGRPRLALETEAGVAIGGSNGAPGGYLVQVDTTGAPQAAQWLGTGVSAATGVAFDGAATFVAGATEGPAEPLNIPVSFEAAPDAFLIAADVPWGVGFVSSAPVTAGKVAATGLAVFAVGDVAGATNFGGKMRTLSGQEAGGYVVGYNLAGSASWVRVLRSSVAVDVLGVAATVDGVYVVGSFEGWIQIGGEAMPSAGGKDIFVVHYSNGGGLRWYRTFGGSGDDIAYAVAAHGGGAITVVGQFAGSVDFGTGGPVTAVNGANAFALRLAPEP